jgi:UDP-N-acetyl-D-galactosamine dehydrogenase
VKALTHFKAKEDLKIAIIGLGYVGLPLAIEFARKFHVVGFDLNKQRIGHLRDHQDHTGEVTTQDLKETSMRFSHQEEDIEDCNVYIVTVPTPITDSKTPDLTPIINACTTVGKILKPHNVVIFESTVYPGCTEDDCVPLLEKISGLKFNQDFYCGYSPERVNPGDKEHSLPKIKKITSGSTPACTDFVDALYSAIITAGTHKVSSLKVAEAAKVIENTQRDLNIAFMNELSKIFHLLKIDTQEVLEAAGTKWNFLKFTPGLVGGHCIGVDPYYLTHKAKSLGYHPEVILAGRKINDEVGEYVAHQMIKLMIKKSKVINQSKVLILGITFKENCPDIRNSKVVDIIRELKDYGITVDCHDPRADKHEVLDEYGLTLQDINVEKKFSEYDAVVVAVAHKEFKSLNLKKSEKTILVDLKSMFAKENSDLRL